MATDEALSSEAADSEDNCSSSLIFIFVCLCVLASSVVTYVVFVKGSTSTPHTGDSRRADWSATSKTAAARHDPKVSKTEVDVDAAESEVPNTQVDVPKLDQLKKDDEMKDASLNFNALNNSLEENDADLQNRSRSTPQQKSMTPHNIEATDFIP